MSIKADENLPERNSLRLADPVLFEKCHALNNALARIAEVLEYFEQVEAHSPLGVLSPAAKQAMEEACLADGYIRTFTQSVGY